MVHTEYICTPVHGGVYFVLRTYLISWRPWLLISVEPQANATYIRLVLMALVIAITLPSYHGCDAVSSALFLLRPFFPLLSYIFHTCSIAIPNFSPADYSQAAAKPRLGPAAVIQDKLLDISYSKQTISLFFLFAIRRLNLS